LVVEVKQCVGEKNYKYFLLYIVGHAVLCLYGAVIGTLTFISIVVEGSLMNLAFRVEATGEVINATAWVVIQYLFFKYTSFFFITVLCWVMGVTLSIFFVYHMSLVKSGNTTNEKIKRGDYKYALDKEISIIDQKLATYHHLLEEEKQDLRKERKTYSTALEKMERLPYDRGFRQNLNDIMYA